LEFPDHYWRRFMTESLEISTSEIRRVGVWALRALGYSFGVADRGAAVLSNAACGGAPVLKLLRNMEHEIRASFSAPSTEVTRTAAGYRLEANGRSLIEVGPPAIDLATARARLVGDAVVNIDGVFGIAVIPGLQRLASERGLATAIAWVCSNHERSSMALEFGTGWQAFNGTLPTTRGSLTDTSIFDYLSLASNEDVGRVITREFEMLNSAAASARGSVTIVAIPAQRFGIEQNGALTRHSHEIRAELADFLNFYALERKAWAPTSERSHTQAAI
jgi:hypothetical protein